jgi:hypothetical protein
MSLFLRASLPDIRDIMLRADYDRFPTFIDVDKRLEWIEAFAPYHDARVYIRNNFDELADIDPVIAKSLYRKIEQTLGLLHQHKDMALLKIKEEYDRLYQQYLVEENQEFGFKTLCDLMREHDIEFRMEADGELTLCEQQYNLVIVPFRKEYCLIKRTFLEIFWDEGDDANPEFLLPIKEFLIQEIMDVPIDLSSASRRFGVEGADLVQQIGSTYGIEVHTTPSSQSE